MSNIRSQLQEQLKQGKKLSAEQADALYLDMKRKNQEAYQRDIASLQASLMPKSAFGRFAVMTFCPNPFTRKKEAPE